ncbi:MAG: PH domain-containing protein [Owenweeksia sp.]|nr:PH domain-containing protein [Owenweeksia sp.]
MWYLGFAPWYGFGLIFLVRGTRYQIYKEKLLVKNPFERKQVPLHSIHQVEGIKNPLWKRCVLGVPSHSLKVAYQQQEELMLHPAKPKELQRLLQEKTSA